MAWSKEQHRLQKPRIAFLGVGVGLHAEHGVDHGLPMLLALLERLAVDFDIVVYSLIRVKQSSLPEGVQLRQIAKRKLPGYAAYFLVVCSLVVDHLRRPFSVLNAISAFPSGRIVVLLGKILRRPAVVHLIGSETVMMPEIGYGDLLIPRLKKITRWVCEKADVLIVQTEYQKKITVDNLQLGRVPTVLSRRVDAKKFPYRERTITYPVNFLHVASFQPVKDQETLFRAFARIVGQIEGHLTLVGDGFDHPNAKKLLRDLGIEDKVKWAGHLKHSEVRPYFDAAHILLHTSLYESLCGVVQEAMASGLPVCGTNVGILSDLGDTFAAVVPKHDPDELVASCLQLISDPARYRQLQIRAHDYIINHDADWAAKKYKELFLKWLN